MQINLTNHSKSYILFPFFLLNMISTLVLKFSFAWFAIFNAIVCTLATLIFVLLMNRRMEILHKAVLVLYNVSILSLVMGISGDYIIGFQSISDIMIAIIPISFIAFILAQAWVIKKY